MANLWTRFWGLNRWVKGTAILVVVLIVASIIGAATGNGSDDDAEVVAPTDVASATSESDEPEPADDPAAPPAPTRTPPPPPTSTPEPEPVVLEGFGQFATNPILLPSTVSVATFTHNGSRNFVVKVFQGSDQDLLVNEIGAYQGSRPILGLEPVVLDIDADGAWTVRIEPIGLATSPAFGGSGDAVSGLFDPPSTGPWTVEHNGQRNFVVWLHCASSSDLVQNEIGPVSGSTVISFGDGPCFWEIEADGGWALNPR